MATPPVSLLVDVLTQGEVFGPFGYLIQAVDLCSEEAGGCEGCPLRAECLAEWDAWMENDAGARLATIWRRLPKIQARAERRRALTTLFAGSGAAFSSSAPEASGRSRPGRAARLEPVGETAMA